MDLGFLGNPYTWTNDRGGNGLNIEELDRGLANGDWWELFPRATGKRLARLVSDHAPLLLDSIGDTDWNPRPFKFEAFWANDVCNHKVVEEVWRREASGSPVFTLCHSL